MIPMYNPRRQGPADPRLGKGLARLSARCLRCAGRRLPRAVGRYSGLPA